jgi:short-subunit dehydrogenase
MLFQDKVVIVTGASSGVGEACAKHFAAQGAKVVLAARSVEPLNALALTIGNGAIAIATDVAKLEACQALVDQTIAAFGKIDVLVNNAGYHARGDVAECTVEGLDQTIDVNLKGPIRLSRMALPHLLKSPHGSIVNVASLAGRFPLDGEAVYSASKFGLRAFSIALAEELRETALTVSLVSPGPIDTGFIMDHIEEVPDMVFSQPMSSADDIAEAVLACATDGKRERAIPAASGVLATAGYLMPGLRRLLKPVLNAQGKKAKAKYLKRGSVS